MAALKTPPKARGQYDRRLLNNDLLMLFIFEIFPGRRVQPMDRSQDDFRLRASSISLILFHLLSGSFSRQPSIIGSSQGAIA